VTTVIVQLNDKTQTKWTIRKVKRWNWKDGILTVIAQDEELTFPERSVIFARSTLDNPV